MKCECVYLKLPSGGRYSLGKLRSWTLLKANFLLPTFFCTLSILQPSLYMHTYATHVCYKHQIT